MNKTRNEAVVMENLKTDVSLQDTERNEIYVNQIYKKYIYTKGNLNLHCKIVLLSLEHKKSKEDKSNIRYYFCNIRYYRKGNQKHL